MKISESCEFTGFSIHQNRKVKALVANALLKLAARKHPLVQRIKTDAAKVVFWCPANVSISSLDIENFRIADSRRIAAALSRAFERLKRPVNSAEVEAEIKRDALLHLTSKSSTANLLQSASKNQISISKGTCYNRVDLLAEKVGVAKGKTYFCPPEADLNNARHYVELLSLTNRWKDLINAENIELFETCKLSGTAIGRARFLLESASNINDSLTGITELVRGGTFSENLQPAIELQTEIKNTIVQVQKWLSQHSFPEPSPETLPEVEMWTAEDLLNVYVLLYPLAIDKNTDKIIARLYKPLPRVLNPKFISRSCSNPIEAERYLFDRTNALIYAALKWGGAECRFQALSARHELGGLRDYRFIIPELKSINYEARLAAISCLAFLQSPETHEYLCFCLRDENANVRQAALWAYAFIGGPEWKSLAEERKDNEPNSEARTFAETIANAANKDLWFI